MQNGLPSTHRETVAEIKKAAVQQVQGLRGITPNILLRTARDQVTKAGTLENEGDLRGALRSLTMAAQLVQRLMESPELKAEKQLSGLKGPLFKDLSSFTQVSFSSYGKARKKR